MLTYLANDFVILEDTPGDVDAVIVPVRPGHMLVDIGIDTRHLEVDRRFPSAPTIERCAAGLRGGCGVTKEEAGRGMDISESRNS